MKNAWEILAKAVGGGVLVVAFAMFAQLLSPKRFAGVFAAAPTVALASLTITCLFKGPADAKRATAGMVAGAVAFLAYTLSAPSTVRRFGALRGSALNLFVWVLAATAALPLASLLPSAKAVVGALPSSRRPATVRNKPKVGIDLSKLKEATPNEALIRLAFGAGTSAIAGVVSLLGRAFIGGTVLAFPAILLASLTLVADEEGQAAARDDARGARCGAVGLIAFSSIATGTFRRLASPAALALAALGWLVVALAAFAVTWMAGRAADEVSQKTGSRASAA